MARDIIRFFFTELGMLTKQLVFLLIFDFESLDFPDILLDFTDLVQTVVYFVFVGGSIFGVRIQRVHF